MVDVESNCCTIRWLWTLRILPKVKYRKEATTVKLLRKKQKTNDSKNHLYIIYEELALGQSHFRCLKNQVATR